jgi:site-specific recombinase XerD
MPDFQKERLSLNIENLWDKEGLLMNTHEEMIQRFIEDYSFRLNPDTMHLYQLGITQLFDYCQKPIDKIKAREIRNWLGHLEEKGYKPATTNTRLAAVKLLFKYAIDEKIITNNPVESIPQLSMEEKIPRYLKMNQLTQLRDLLKGNKRERAMVEFLYVTGVRLSELAAIKKEDIHWSERIINITNGKRKKGRIVLFTRPCEEYLKAYLQEREDDFPFLFVNAYETGPINIRSTQQKFQDYANQLGFKFSPHTLRHTFAAHLAIKGMPFECIQALLGHDQPHLTQIYARLYNQARKEMYDGFM